MPPIRLETVVNHLHNIEFFRPGFEEAHQVLSMKRRLLAIFAVLLLAGCSTQEQTDLKTALVDRFKDDQDLKDYHLDPQAVAECVVKEISATLPGFGGDPRRKQFFEAYAHFVGINSPDAAEKAITDYQELFGSAKNARQAANSITDHVMTCMGKEIESAGPPSRE